MQKNNEVKKIVGEATKEIYKDGLKDTIKSTGKVLSLVPRAINAALSGVEKWILNKEYSLKETKKMLEFKLKNINPEKIKEPEAYVAVPTINALSYSYASDDLLDLYANLLASSMISDTKWKVHPSFVEIIKQLSPDEAKLLKHLSNLECNNEYPLINLCMEKDSTSSIDFGITSFVCIRNFTNIGDEVCDFPKNISQYVDNLARLSIIEIIDSAEASDSDYCGLEKHKIIRDYKITKTLRDGFDWVIRKKYFMITDFGKSFIDICVNPPKTSKVS